MTNEEFFQEFQILYNNIMSNQSPGLDRYEVSVFLTKSQEEFIKGYYNGTIGAFEKTEEVRRYLESLVNTQILQPLSKTAGKLTNNSSLFNLPDDCWFITFESAETTEGCKSVIKEVIPVTQDELHRTLRNPFRGISDRRILRLNSGKKEVELISKYSIESYKIRYVAKPSPIMIAGDWVNDRSLTIDGKQPKNSTDNSYICTLHESLHRKILEGAVQLAIASLKPPSSR